MPNLKSVCILLLIFVSIISHVSGSGGCWAAPVLFGPYCYDPVAIFGSPGLTVGYSIEAKENTGTMICCKVRGYQNNAEKWFDLGCGYGTLTGIVPWGNNLAKKGVTCKGIPFGCMVKF